MYSSFDFGWYSIFSVKNRAVGGGGGLFKRDESYMLIVPKTVAWVQHLFLH